MKNVRSRAFDIAKNSECGAVEKVSSRQIRMFHKQIRTNMRAAIHKCMLLHTGNGASFEHWKPKKFWIWDIVIISVPLNIRMPLNALSRNFIVILWRTQTHTILEEMPKALCHISLGWLISPHRFALFFSLFRFHWNPLFKWIVWKIYRTQATRRGESWWEQKKNKKKKQQPKDARFWFKREWKNRASAPSLFRKVFKYWSFRGGINRSYLRLKFMSMQINQLLFLHSAMVFFFVIWIMIKWNGEDEHSWNVGTMYAGNDSLPNTCNKSKCFICLN